MPEEKPEPSAEPKPEPAAPTEEKPIPSQPVAVKPGLNKAVIIAAIVIGILVVGLIGYFVFRGPTVEGLVITEFLFCNSVEDFVCDENRIGQFNQGNTVYIYLEVEGFEKTQRDDETIIGMFETMETLYENYLTVTTLFLDQEKVLEKGEKSMFVIENHFPTDALEKGIYSVNIQINDLNSNKSVSETREFELI